MHTSSSFKLKTSNQHFIERQKNVFDQLNTLPCNLQNSEMDVDTTQTQRTGGNPNRTLTKHFRGKESIFKRPQLPIRRNYLRTIPDFKKNPHKWTKYSLADVKDEDMSDRSNTKAALSFLNELKKRTDSEDIQEDNCSSKIVFKKVIKTSTTPENYSKPSFRSSKVVMPEYVVGKKKEHSKKNKCVQSDANALKLDHLYGDE